MGEDSLEEVGEGEFEGPGAQAARKRTIVIRKRAWEGLDMVG